MQGAKTGEKWEWGGCGKGWSSSDGMCWIIFLPSTGFPSPFFSWTCASYRAIYAVGPATDKSSIVFATLHWDLWWQIMRSGSINPRLDCAASIITRGEVQIASVISSILYILGHMSLTTASSEQHLDEEGSSEWATLAVLTKQLQAFPVAMGCDKQALISDRHTISVTQIQISHDFSKEWRTRTVDDDQMPCWDTSLPS